MAVVFTESRKMPPEVRAMGHYRDFGYTSGGTPTNMNAESAVADVFRSLTQGAVDFFGGSSSAAKEAAAQAALAQAQAQQQYLAEEGSTKRTLVYVGAGVAGLVLLAVLFSGGRKAPSVSGHRRSRKRRHR